MHIAKDGISQIKIGDVVLQLEGDVLQLTGLDESEIANAEEIKKVIDKLASLNFSEVLGTTGKPEFQQNTPVMEIEISLKSQMPEQYILSKLKDKDDYVLKQSSTDYYFKVPKYVGDDIVGISRANLVQKKPEELVAPAAKAAEETENDQPAETKKPLTTAK